MLYYLHYWSHSFGPLNVFRYISFRATAAAITSLAFCWIFGPWCIRILRRLKAGQPLRGKEEVHRLAELHSQKKGTPTMGGVLILASVTASSLLWGIPTNRYVLLSLFGLLSLGLVGMADDLAKIRQKAARGIPGRVKLLAQGFVAVVVGLALAWEPETSRNLYRVVVPFVKESTLWDLGWVIWPFLMLVVMGASNAVNLTDGLDGLAVGCSITVAFVYAVFAYVAGRPDFAGYLFVPYVRGGGELAVFCAALLGACMGFLWYNCYPAQVFMGDTGSLAIGGAIGIVSICLCQELLLVIAGGIFVLEALSVLLQVGSFKMTGRRIFAMAPLHHHFELVGWSETTVVVRFWILSLLFSMIALSSLKIR
ncbi:phospho-N-acetylmuramoyl-pentapeptide-transferase [Candidatus Methylacidithermus pantelleriae]|nr:phospho-N-acetylmuramoyl-pentapeptide-transferase [Candidatus Methylacidithermus pantelleriae]